MTAAQARSVAANIGKELGDYSFGIQVNAKLIELIGVNGENLLTDPLAIRVKLIEETRKNVQTFGDQAKQAGKWTGKDMLKVGAIGTGGGALAGAATGAIIGSVVPVIGTALGAGIGTQAALSGAAQGAIQPVNEPTGFGTEKATQIGLGAIGGKIGQSIASATGSVMNPLASKAEQTMRELGITPTPGQTLGGVYKKAVS